MFFRSNGLVLTVAVAIRARVATQVGASESVLACTRCRYLGFYGRSQCRPSETSITDITEFFGAQFLFTGPLSRRADTKLEMELFREGRNTDVQSMPAFVLVWFVPDCGVVGIHAQPGAR